jgi:hypothetical protein
MKTFLKRLLMAFAIGLTVGSSFASAAGPGHPGRKPASAEDIYYQTETFIVQANRVMGVKNAMESLGLSEDTDFAWLNLGKNVRGANFVCYSIECHEWAKQALRTYKKAPNRPEEQIGKLWKDPSIEGKRERELTEDEKIKARQTLRYSRVKAG